MPTYRNVNNGVEISVESELSGDWELVEEKKTKAKTKKEAKDDD
nr:MAG TPA: hypothetical protein [Caudoviricetes sp.]